MFSAFNICAYDGATYSIELPENYQKQNFDSSDIWVDAANSHNISVVISPNADGENYKNVDKEYVEALIEPMKAQLESESLSYGEDAVVNINDVSNKLTVVNGYDAIEWNIEFDVIISGDSYTTYQKIYSFASVNYIYTLTFTHFDSPLFSSDEVSALNSFKIKDDLFTEATIAPDNEPQGLSLFAILVIIAAIIIIIDVAVVSIIIIKTRKI
jgi:hypothetical protein